MQFNLHLSSLPELDNLKSLENVEFNSSGELFPGDYAPTINEFEEIFVNIGNRIQRNEIYNGWKSHRRDLLKDGLNQEARILLNGSYTTKKHSPNDVDLAVEVPITSESLNTADHNGPILRLLKGPEMKYIYNCDAYPIYILPEDDPNYSVITLAGVRYWTKWFARNRQNEYKGRVWARVRGLK